MTNDIISKAFTTTRALELEYMKVFLLRETGAESEAAMQFEETGKKPLVAQLACFADAAWQ